MAQAGAIASIDGWIGRETDVDRVVAALTSENAGPVVVAPEPDGVWRTGRTRPAGRHDAQPRECQGDVRKQAAVAAAYRLPAWKVRR
ncbi:hypothetical protein GCM10023334_049170 [Nonomuraea thailandensis]